MGAQAILEGHARRVLDRQNLLATWVGNHLEGCFVTDGGTTQAAGAGGALDFDVDLAIGEGIVKGKRHFHPAGTDEVAAAQPTVAWGATSGKSVVIAVVLSSGVDNDTPAAKAVAGAVADTGSEVAPTDAEITAALGHDNWLRRADVNVERTGTTTVVLVIDHSVAPQAPSHTLTEIPLDEAALRTANAG